MVFALLVVGAGLNVDGAVGLPVVFFTTPCPLFPPGPGNDFLNTMDALGELLEGPIEGRGGGGGEGEGGGKYIGMSMEVDFVRVFIGTRESE